MVDIEQIVFLNLVKAGLWEQDVDLREFGTTNYSHIMQLATEQSVIGLVAAGFEHVADVNVPREMALLYAGQAIQLEQRNKAMNAFVAELIESLRRKDIYTLLVKGQGLAQCYVKPLWRASGDVDLFLSDNNYQRAADYLKTKASSVDEENDYKKHLAMTIDGWSVELHGSLRSGLWKGLDKEVDKVQEDVFLGGKVRLWINGKTQVYMPAADEDVVFVFSHILQHFYKEGIGLRQICDWCRLLYTYRDSLNYGLLESRIHKAGIMTEWKAFAALTVKYLGMPVEAMPFYSSDQKWLRKAKKILGFVFETGNFGHNRDYSYRNKYPYVMFKAISLWKHIQDFGRYFLIFPLDAIKVICRKICVGVSVTIRGGNQEL